jgi:outer membrane protein OmpA-like peptidoglycan-associated protein
MAESPEQSTSSETSPPADGAAAEAAQESLVMTGEHRESAPEPTRKGALHSLWALVVRLLILGFGMSLGWILGVLVAQVFPSGNPNPPLQEVVMRRTGQTWRKVRQLPQWWLSNGTIAPGADVPTPAETPVVELEVPPRLTLSPELQQQVDEELALLQTDLAALESRLADLEASLGEDNPDGALETRLQQLDQLLNPPNAAKAPATLPPPPVSPTAEADARAGVYTEPPFSRVTDSIVLPSSLLFEPGGSLLTPQGKQLLGTILPDLQRYPSATLLVGSHTAGDNEPQVDRKLTFQQAMAVQRYLDQQLGDIGIHWVILGYGQTRPRAAGHSPEAQQRNQRIEIGIVP